MTTNLKSAKLLFEPAPPSPQPISNTVNYCKQSPTARRRVQSAKDGRWRHLQAPDGIKERPRSAVLSSERILSGRLTRKPPSGRTVKPLVGQNLIFNPTSVSSSPSKSSNSRISHVENPPPSASRRTAKPEIGSSGSAAAAGVNDVELPSGISALAPWLTPSISQRLIGVDPSSCLVFLPSMVDCDDLPVVPPMQSSDGPLRYTAVRPKEKPFDPKKLFHYDVLKNRPHSADHVCDHRKKEVGSHLIYDRDGKLLYDERKYHQSHTKEMIQKEIEDLENLLQGIGSEDSDNMLARYQYEINVLHQTAKETLTRHIYEQRVQKFPQPLQDLTGLRAYLKRREKMIQRIRERREKCIRELERLNKDLGTKVIVIPSSAGT